MTGGREFQSAVAVGIKEACIAEVWESGGIGWMVLAEE